MGFGFNLFAVFVLFPLIGILILVWIISGKKIFGKLAAFIIIFVIGFVLFVFTLKWFNSKTILDKKDYHGEYVINRNYFKGEQADWQYNHYRFEINKDDTIIFYETDGDEILETYKGKIRTTSSYKSARLMIEMEKPSHHILQSIQFR